MTVSLNRQRSVLLLFVAVVATAVFVYWYSPLERILKRDQEIERIIEKNCKFDVCIQYALVARVDGWYSCYGCTSGKIFLKAGEIWKYGKTCLGEIKRYAKGLPDSRLSFIVQFNGTEKECLVEEKNKIYNYPNLPESKLRKTLLVRPPGNKIDR